MINDICILSKSEYRILLSTELLYGNSCYSFYGDHGETLLFSDLREDFVGPEIPLSGKVIPNGTMIFIDYPVKNPIYGITQETITTTGKLLFEIGRLLKDLLLDKPTYGIPNHCSFGNLYLRKMDLYEPKKIITTYIESL